MPRLQMPETPAAELELIDDLLLEWHATDAARATARYTLCAFARWLAERDLTLATATTQDCLAWLDQRASEVKAVTVAKNWSELRAWYACAAIDPTDPLDGRASPMARIKMPRHPKYALTHAATVDEADAVIRSFDLRTGIGLRNATAVSLMFRSGLRVSECSRLDLADVDLDRRSVSLGLTKNLEPRRPALHPETLTFLRRYLRRRGQHPGPLFVNAGPRRMSERIPTKALETVVKRAAAKAAVPVTAHALRRGFVVEYIAHGGDIPTLMILGGWSSEAMIYRYLGDARNTTARTVYDTVAARQVAARRPLRAVN